MTPQQLKNSILQRAIEGRLVEQRAEEGTARELLEEIQAEKDRLVKEKKIKKSKPLPLITEEERPFDIPDGWEWVRLDEVAQQIGDIDHKMPPTVIDGIPYISPVNFTSSGIDFDNAKKISYKDYERLSQKIKPERGDIIFPRYGTIGVIRQVNTDMPFLASYSCCVIKLLQKYMNKSFIRYVLDSPLTKSEINRYINKTTQPNVGLKSIQQFLFPLPPLAEQQRIVYKIEELLPFIDKYGNAHTKLKAFNTRFPESMKKSLLQYAIQGKLVEQRADEGTAQDLIKEIQAEKKRLIEEKKIKKTKALSPITEEEIPFDIPEGWEWVRLDSIVYNHGQEKPNEPFSYIDIGSVDNIRQRLGKEDNVILPENAPSRARKIVENGDIIYSTVRPYLHNMCIIDRDFSYTPIASTGFAVMATYKSVNNKYLFYYLLSPTFDSYANSNENSKGVAYPAINDKALYSAVVPIPPLPEQQRIVEKIEELLPFCDKLNK